MPTFTHLCNGVLEIPVPIIQQEKETECFQIEKEEVKLLWFADDMILYKKNLICHPEVLELRNI